MSAGCSSALGTRQEMICRLVVALTAVLCACSSSGSAGSPSHVTRQDMGSDWPLTVDGGIFMGLQAPPS
jgi:hypothetical protein